MEVIVNKQTKKVKVPFDAEKYDGTQKVVCRINDYIVKGMAYHSYITDEYPVVAIIQDYTDVSAQVMTKNGKMYDDKSGIDSPYDLFFELEEESEPEITIKCSKEELIFIGKCFGNLYHRDYNNLELDATHPPFHELYNANKSLGVDLLDGYKVELKVK